jgi:hypothetical protein
MHGLSLSLLILAASARGGVTPGRSAASSSWEKVFDGDRDKWAGAIAATGRDMLVVGGAWGTASVTKTGATVESTHGHGVLGFFVESPSSVYALGEGELIWHFDGKTWSEEHVGPLPPRNQRRPFSDHMLYRMHDKDGQLVAFGLELVLVKQPNGTWVPPPQSEREQLRELGAFGPKLPDGPSNCGGRYWHWFGRNRAFFTCDDHRAFVLDEGTVTPKGRLPRQCGSTMGALAYATGEVFATCGPTLWKTEGGAWRRVDSPYRGSRELSSVAFADHCVFVAGGRTVWRSCER